MKKLLIIPLMIILIIPFVISANVECENAVNYIANIGNDVNNFKEAIGDLDGDGDNDIAISEFANDRYSWFENDGLGNFINHTIDGSFNGAAEVVVIDIDGDDDNDIIGRNSLADTSTVFINNGQGSFTASSFSSGADTSGNAIADFNQDGEIDIATVTVTDDKLRIYTNDGSENFILALTYSFSDSNYIRPLDVDGDNDIDIISANYLAGTVKWIENNGILGFTEHTIASGIDTFDIAGADLDGDGDIDIVAANYDDGTQEQLQWYENDGNEVFTSHNISHISEVRTLEVADLDNDGDYDIITGDTDTDKLAIWENDGDGGFTENNITDNFEPHAISIADINGDDVLDIVFFDNINENLGFIDGDNCQAYPTRSRFIECEFPSLFCDDFNYANPMSANNWLIQLGGDVINNSFTPIENKLRLQNDQNIYPYHETDAFETSYRPDSGSRFTRHEVAPIFSSQFYLNMTNQSDNQFFYTAMEKQYMRAYSIKAEIDAVGNSSGNMNWYYLNESQPSTVWALLCANCTHTEQETFIKINSLFAHRDEFPFNSSILDDEIHIYADYELIGIIEDYDSPRLITIKQYEFGKLTNSNYTIDDYYVMVGTDTETPTFEQYYEDYFIDDDVINETTDYGKEGTGDMAEALETIWDDMGLLSIASRIMTGLFLMFLLALIMFAMALKMGHNLSAGVLILVEMFFMILLVYIRLLPIWLPFVIVLIAAGVGAAVIKLGTQT